MIVKHPVSFPTLQLNETKTMKMRIIHKPFLNITPYTRVNWGHYYNFFSFLADIWKDLLENTDNIKDRKS